jgi:hypothetical protein
MEGEGGSDVRGPEGVGPLSGMRRESRVKGILRKRALSGMRLFSKMTIWPPAGHEAQHAFR